MIGVKNNPFKEPFKRVPSKISRRGMVSYSSQDTQASNSVQSKRVCVSSSTITIDRNTSTDKSTGQTLKRKRSCEIVSAEAKLKDNASIAQEPLPTNHNYKARYCEKTAPYHLTLCKRNQYVQTPRTFLLHRTIASQTDKEPPLLLIDNEAQTKDVFHNLANNFVDTSVEVYNDEKEKLRSVLRAQETLAKAEVAPDLFSSEPDIATRLRSKRTQVVALDNESSSDTAENLSIVQPKKKLLRSLNVSAKEIRLRKPPALRTCKNKEITSLKDQTPFTCNTMESSDSGSLSRNQFSSFKVSRSCDNSLTNGFDVNIVTNSSKQKPESRCSENSRVAEPCDNSSSNGFEENNITVSSSQTAFKSHISTCSSVFKEMRVPVCHCSVDAYDELTPRTASGYNFESFTSQVLRMLADLNTKMDSLLQSAKQGNWEFCIEDDKIQLPINDRDELQQLENVLLEDSVKNNMVLKLMVWGGRNVDDITRRILKNTFGPNLAVDVNWNGANGKVAFFNLSIRSVIISAVRRNKNLKSVTDYEVEKIIKKWLKYAKDRNGGRNKRSC